MKKTFSIKISGPAGTGIMVAGETFSKALNRLGFFTLVYPEYPSRIRGGDNNIQIVSSAKENLAPREKIDLLLAFGKENFKRHAEEQEGPEGTEGLGRYEVGEIGLDKIAKELGSPLVLNTAGLGFLWGVLGFEIKPLLEQIKEDFAQKKDVAEINVKAVEKGYERAPLCPAFGGTPVGVKGKIVNLTGNEALVEGILKAQCEFAAVYPMTPINAILTRLASAETSAKSRRGVQLFRPEDEIAGIMSAIGASYAGKRAMVATSGGGFSLMIEGVGMAGMTEIPLVIVLGQRTGPSSGIATYSSQSDLNFAIYGGHGEFPRIVLTPGDLPELYRLGIEAFALSERYQVPVILMTDKYLAESRFTAEKLGDAEGPEGPEGPEGLEGLENYRRYKFTENGISPRAFPGQTAFLTNSYEHDEFGFSSDEAENRTKMMEKRMKKTEGLEGGYEKYGPEGPERTLVSWGSTKNALLGFVKEHPEFSLIHIWRPWPFSEDLKKLLDKQKDIIVVEGNYSGQLAGLIEKETGLRPGKILKDNGRPFFKEEIERKINELTN